MEFPSLGPHMFMQMAPNESELLEKSMLVGKTAEDQTL
jgi:hypothetical protein